MYTFLNAIIPTIPIMPNHYSNFIPAYIASIILTSTTFIITNLNSASSFVIIAYTSNIKPIAHTYIAIITYIIITFA
jgi:hypothetical protein